MHCSLSEKSDVKILTYFMEEVIKRDPQPDSYRGQCKLGLIKVYRIWPVLHAKSRYYFVIVASLTLFNYSSKKSINRK